MSPNTKHAMFGLEEAGLPYEVVTVDLMSGEQKGDAYRGLNPTARVPTLVDEDFVLWESNAILEYVAALAPAKRLGGENAKERAEIARVTFMTAAHLSPAVARIFAHTIRLPEDQRNPKIVEESRAEVDRSLIALDGFLKGSEFLACGRFTIADLAVFPVLANAGMLRIDLAQYPEVTAWTLRMGQRAAWKKIDG
jgi:glutathione S-transferase